MVRDKTESRSLQIKFSLIEAFFFAIFAAASYQTSYLMEVGLTSAQIGLVTSVGTAVALLVLPLWGAAGDRVGSARRPFLFCLVATTVFYFFLPAFGRLFSGWFPAFFLYLPLLSSFKQPANALLDGWAVGQLAPRGIGYGSVRMWGSIGFSVASFLFGLAAGNGAGTGWIFYCTPVFLLPLLVCARGLPAVGGGEGAPRGHPAPGQLLKNRRFLAYLCYTVALNLYLAVTSVFMAYILVYAGCSDSMLGVLFGFRALMEICSMRLAGSLRKRLSLAALLTGSGLFFGVEHLLYRFAHGLPALLGIMVLSGLGGGIFYGLGPNYVYEIVPEGSKNTAQS